jgi:hypothetical protein
MHAAFAESCVQHSREFGGLADARALAPYGFA